MNYKAAYTPVDPDFYDMFDQLIASKRSGKIFYFNPENTLDEATGSIRSVVRNANGHFLETDSGHQIRLDRLITFYGKPGPAYDEYDRYGNACLTCEDLGQF